jgi:hypothetical protein
MSSNQSWLRRLRPLFLAGCLLAGPATTAPVFAQPPAPAAEEEEKSEGRPLDGYLLMVMLASLTFFVVGKTARR